MIKYIDVVFDADDMDPLMDEIRRLIRGPQTGIDFSNYWTWVMVQIFYEIGIDVPFGTDLCNDVVADINEVVEEIILNEDLSSGHMRKMSELVAECTDNVNRLMNKPGVIETHRLVKDVLCDYTFDGLRVTGAAYNKFHIELEMSTC